MLWYLLAWKGASLVVHSAIIRRFRVLRAAAWRSLKCRHDVLMGI